jgi:hypothetical protein
MKPTSKPRRATRNPASPRGSASPYRCMTGSCDFSVNARGRLVEPQPRNKPRLKKGASPQ